MIGLLFPRKMFQKAKKSENTNVLCCGRARLTCQKNASKVVIALYMLCTSCIVIGPSGRVVKMLENGATNWSHAEDLGFKSVWWQNYNILSKCDLMPLLICELAD